ncbi:MAG: hypothetical protein Alis3KO_36100 [Aliiglaciecola sp.]
MTETELIKLVAEESGIDVSKVNTDSSLLGDLKIDGDDAWSILEKCHDLYGLDLANFEFQQYFRNEPCLKGPVYLYRKSRYEDEHIASRKQCLTIRRLLEACKNGHW